MKTLAVNCIVASLVVIGTLAGCTSSNAPDAVFHGDDKPAAANAPATLSHVQAPEGEATTLIPATADGIWQAIDQKTAELQKTIQAGTLDEVHHLAFAIRDLVAALPERSGALSADRQGKVREDVRFVATLAERLDASGDAKDAAGTQANYDKLVSILKDLRTNDPGNAAK